MDFDIADPRLQVALIALGGVVLAAVVGFLGAVAGAAIGARAARETDERRHAWDVQQWHREKGVAAAEAILDLMIEMDLNLFSYYGPRQQENWQRTGHAEHPEPDHGDLEPFYARIRRHALAIKHEQVMDSMLAMADCLFNWRSIENWGGPRGATSIWYQLLRDTEAILGAYIRGDPIPHAKNIDTLKVTLDEYREETSR